MRIITLLIGVVVTAIGIFSLSQPGGTLSVLAFPAGAGMLLVGINRILLSFAARNRELSRWLFAEGILTLLLAGIILADNVTSDVAAWTLIGSWTLFAGLQRLFTTYMFKQRGMKSWSWDLFMNILVLACGILSTLQQTTATVSFSTQMGILFMLHGISLIVLGLILPKSIKIWYHRFRNHTEHTPIERFSGDQKQPGETDER